MALSKVETWVAEVDDIEAVAALWGLQMVYTIGVCDIIFEWDSLWTIEALNTSSPNLLRQGPLFDDIKTLLQHINSYGVVHVGRDDNALAHKIAS